MNSDSEESMALVTSQMGSVRLASTDDASNSRMMARVRESINQRMRETQEMKSKFLELIRPAFTNLETAYGAHLIAKTYQLVLEKKFDSQTIQILMDELLVKLIDTNQVQQIVRYVTKPSEHLNDVMLQLVSDIAMDLLSKGESWESFIGNLRTKVTEAGTYTLSKREKNQANRFIEALRQRLSNHLVTNLPTKLGEDYVQLDGQFKALISEVLQLINAQVSPITNNSSLYRRIAESVVKQLRENGAMPRCEQCCPWCNSMCILKAGHDLKVVKHDTIHQPEGLGGVNYDGLKELNPKICSNKNDQASNCSITKHGERLQFFWYEWDKIYPAWVKPNSANEECLLRQYIFYNYHEAFAKHYGKKPCSDMNPTYNQDLSAIKENLKQKRKNLKIL